MYYLMIRDGIIYAIGEMQGRFKEITLSEYEQVKSMLESKPESPDADHVYVISENLEWMLVEIDKSEKEISNDEAVGILLGETDGDNE